MNKRRTPTSRKTPPQAASEAEVAVAGRPDIFRFHDYREFLKAWFDYLKQEKGISLRQFAKGADLASGYLPMVLSGKRPLSAKALAKLSQSLGLSPNERSYLDALVLLGTSDSQALRLEALERMKRFGSYREQNPRETEVHEYLTRWYYVAIREMSALPDFQLDPEWVQQRLRHPVPLKEVKDALVFLKEGGYLQGSPVEKNLDCLGGIYRLALAQFHRQMFELAAHSIEITPSPERSILGHTFALDAQGFDRAREILNEAFEKIRALEKEGTAPRETVYHAELALFPLTQGRKAK